MRVLSSLEQILEALLAHPYHFRLMWPVITVAAAIFAASGVGLAATPSDEKVKTRPINFIVAWRDFGTPKPLVAPTLLALFLSFYIAVILVWEDFSYNDNDMFTLITLKGQDIGMPIWNFNGRFFPFGHQEFNVIRHFTHSAIGYHVLPIAQLLIFFCILLALDSELSITARASLAILALLTPSVLISFSTLIVPERNILFFLAFFVMSVKQFEQAQSKAWAVAAVVCAQIMLFYKETVFLLLLGFAVARLILRLRSESGEEWNYRCLWDKEYRLDFCFALLAGLFLLQYFAALGIHVKMNYVVEQKQPLLETALSYLRLDLLAWLLMAVVMGRIYLILRHRATPSLLWDGLGFGGVACFIGYLALRMYSAYYLAPVDLIAMLYVGRLALLSWQEVRSWRKPAALLIGSAVVLQDLAFSAFAVFERKNVIHGKAEIASVVEARYRTGAENVRRLFFPFASPYVIDQFAAYLNYRGVSVERAVGEAAGPNSVVLVTKTPFAHSWRCAWCRAASRPAPGDLVIVLPEDEASSVEAAAYREGGELLFSYDPCPRLPHGLYALVGTNYIATVKYSPALRPDRWMSGSVTLWK